LQNFASICIPPMLSRKAALRKIHAARQNQEPLQPLWGPCAAEAGLSVPALQSAYYRELKKAGRDTVQHAARKLTIVRETILKFALQAFSLENTSVKGKDIREIVSNKWDIEVSPTWVSRYLKRNQKELGYRNTKALTKSRTDPEIRQAVEAWIEAVQKEMQEQHYPPHAVFDGDESLVRAQGTLASMARVEALTKDRFNFQMTRGDKNVTILPFVSASGSVFFNLFVVATGKDDEEARMLDIPIVEQGSTRSSGPQALYAFSKNGRLTAEHWELIIDKFCDMWQVQHPGLRCIIFCDQLGIHRNPSVVERALSRNVRLFSFCSATTHWLQPLDDKVFGILKNRVGIEYSDLSRAAFLSGDSPAGLLLEATYRAVRASETQVAIQASFASTGVYPFNEDRIRLLADLNHGPLGPPKEPKVPEELAAECVDMMRTEIRRVQGKRKRSCGSIRVKAGRGIFSPEQLLAEHRAREAAAKQAAMQKEDNRLAKTCRGLGCSRAFRGGQSWLVCSVCQRFAVCLNCAKRGSQPLFRVHEASCKPLRKRQRTEGEYDSDDDDDSGEV